MITCIVGSTNPVKVRATESALRKVLNTDSVKAIGQKVPSGVAEQPMTAEETRAGAVNRVKACIVEHAESHVDWFVAIEGGVELTQDGPVTFAYVAISDGAHWSIGRSATLPLPQQVYTALEQGQELGNVMDKVFNTNNVKQKEGAIGLLTNQLATRQSVYELALILSMSKFKHANLFKA